LIHLTSGIADTINAFIHGILLGSAFWITRRVSVCIVSHYLIDLKIFGGF
jgi:membrane protease YdiL (CAAX protease family)